MNGQDMHLDTDTMVDPINTPDSSISPQPDQTAIVTINTIGTTFSKISAVSSRVSYQQLRKVETKARDLGTKTLIRTVAPKARTHNPGSTHVFW
jgi:hypothetical protein